jgi:arsenate reductase (thioredoxin)
MAEAFFNRMAQGRARAISAGSQPADKPNPTVVQAMQEIGIDISQNKPRLLTPEMTQGITMAITMGCQEACPFVPGEKRDWGLPDPEDQPIEEVRKIRDEIKKKTAALVQEITGL